LITLVGLLVGFTAIMLILKDRQVEAAWLLLLCTILDKLDGTAARLLKASSNLGIELDSLSDMVTFVVSPAILWGSVLLGGPGPQSLYWTTVVFSSLGLFVASGALRLARFNVSGTDPLMHYYFRGIATTLAGAVAVSLFLTLEHYQVPRETYLAWVPPIIALLGFGMNAPFLFPKVKRTSNRVMTTFFMVSGLLSVPLVIFRLLPEALLAISVSYVVLGFLAGNVYPGKRLRELRPQVPDRPPEQDR
jgi:CDP-diacylglycerol--serine O-phosphatidyltransferase